MTNSEETAYAQGYRAAWSSVLSTALRNLGYDSLETQQAAWVVEREEAIQKLRGLCREHGDNNWPDELNLADIIEKHLGDYLDIANDDYVGVVLPDLSTLKVFSRITPAPDTTSPPVPPGC